MPTLADYSGLHLDLELVVALCNTEAIFCLHPTPARPANRPPVTPATPATGLNAPPRARN